MPLFGPPNVSKMKNGGDVKGLIKALRYQKDEQVRFDAAVALGELYKFKKPITLAVDPLISCFLETDDHLLSRMSALSLARIINQNIDEDHVTKIVNAFVKEYEQNPNKERQSSIISALEHIRGINASDLLISITEGEEVELRYAALQSLSWIHRNHIESVKKTKELKASGGFVFDPKMFPDHFNLDEVKAREARIEAQYKKIENTLVTAVNDYDENMRKMAKKALENLG